MTGTTDGARPRSLMRSTVVMASGTLVSRALGFLRAVVLAAAIGLVGTEANIFDVANRIPNTIYLLVAGGVLNAVLVPQIVRAARDPDGGRQYVDRLITFSVLGLVLVTGLALVASPLILALYAGDSWNGAEYALAGAFALWLLPQVFFYGLYTVLGQVLNARGSFGPYMWAPVLNNVVAITGLVVFIALFGRGDGGQHRVDAWDPTMVAVLCGTSTLGVVAQALVLVVPLSRMGFRWRPRLRGEGSLTSASSVALWTFGGLLVSQLVFVVVTRVALGASGDGNAGPAVFGYAYLLYILPHSLIAVSLVTALFTRISTHVSEKRDDLAHRDLGDGLRTLGVATILSAVLLGVLGVPAGVFINPSDGALVGPVVAAMALGLPAYSAFYLVSRGFYAREDAKRPFLGTLVSSLVTLVASLLAALLPDALVVVGLGVAQSLGNFAGLGLLLVLSARQSGSLEGGVGRTHALAAVSALVAGVVGWFLGRGLDEWFPDTRLGALGEVVTGGLVMTAVYLVMLKLLKVEEFRKLLGSIRQKRRPEIQV